MQVVREAIYDAFYKLTDSRSQITSYVFDVVRSTVPKINLDDVFTTKEEIAFDVKQELTKSMGDFGFQIIQTLVTDIEPDMKVRAAMNEINAAQRLRCGTMPQLHVRVRLSHEVKFKAVQLKLLTQAVLIPSISGILYLLR